MSRRRSIVTRSRTVTSLLLMVPQALRDHSHNRPRRMDNLTDRANHGKLFQPTVQTIGWIMSMGMAMTSRPVARISGNRVLLVTKSLSRPDMRLIQLEIPIIHPPPRSILPPIPLSPPPSRQHLVPKTMPFPADRALLTSNLAPTTNDLRREGVGREMGERRRQHLLLWGCLAVVRRSSSRPS